MPKKQKNNRLFHFLIALLALILLFSPLFFKLQLREFQSLGLIGIFFINLIGSATIFLPAPSFISIGVGGNIYNPLLVALIGAVGSSLGELIGYIFGFSSKKVIAFEKKHKVLDGFMRFLFEKYGNLTILLFSFIPNPIFDGIGIFAGISEYKIEKFITFVFIGRLLRYIIIAYIGYSL